MTALRLRLASTVLTTATALALAAGAARADTGHLALTLGGAAFDEGGVTRVHPTLRGEAAVSVLGPLALGAYLDATAAELVFRGPAFGGGLVAAVRTTLPLVGLGLHLEASGGRLQLPTAAQGRVDAWSVGLGAGLGMSAGIPGVSLEARALRTWYLGIHEGAEVGEDAWTFGLAVAVSLP